MFKTGLATGAPPRVNQLMVEPVGGANTAELASRGVTGFDSHIVLIANGLSAGAAGSATTLMVTGVLVRLLQPVALLVDSA